MLATLFLMDQGIRVATSFSLHFLCGLENERRFLCANSSNSYITKQNIPWAAFKSLRSCVPSVYSAVVIRPHPISSYPPFESTSNASTRQPQSTSMLIIRTISVPSSSPAFLFSLPFKIPTSHLSRLFYLQSMFRRISPKSSSLDIGSSDRSPAPSTASQQLRPYSAWPKPFAGLVVRLGASLRLWVPRSVLRDLGPPSRLASAHLGVVETVSVVVLGVPAVANEPPRREEGNICRR